MDLMGKKDGKKTDKKKYKRSAEYLKKGPKRKKGS
jgi:hypothetical protein